MASQGKRARKSSGPTIPQALPCGCMAVVKTGKKYAIRTVDGHRRCQLHERKWKLVFEEVLPGPVTP